MDSENNGPEPAGNTPEADSTGNRGLDQRLSSGVLKGDTGTEAAQVWISAFLIAMLGFLVYLGSFSIPLHGDDLRLFQESTALHRLVTAPGAVELMPSSPLSAIGLALSSTLTGGRVDALHGTSLLLHLCCAVLVFLIARRLLPRGTPEVLAMLAGLIFVVHPALTGAVNYLGAYPVLQSSLFGLLGLLLLLRGASRPPFSVPPLAGAVLCFVLAFGSDTSALLLPLLGLGLLRLLPADPDGGRDFARAAAPVLVLTLVVLWIAGSAAGLLGPDVVTTGATARASAFTGFLGKVVISAVWPFQQGLLPEPGRMLPGLVLGLLAAAGIAAGFRGRPVPGLVGLWVLFTAFSIACYGPADTIATTRYSYLPLAGLAMLLPWALLQIPYPGAYRGASGLAAAAILALGFFTFQETNRWRTPEALWQAEAARQPDALEPWLKLGRFAWARARMAPAEAAREEQLYATALKPWQAVLERAPGHIEAEKYLGMIHFEMGAYDEAEPLLARAAVRAPEDADIAVYLAFAREQQARATGDREKIIGALRAFRRAARLESLPREARLRYGMLAAGAGDLETGIPLLESTVEEDEDTPLAEPLRQYKARTEQQEALGQRAEALLRENPDSAEGLLIRSEKLLLEGRTLAAFYLLQYVMDQAPEQDAVWALLGFTSARMSAADQFLAERGESRTSDIAIWEHLAFRTARGGLWEAAETYLRRGAELTGALEMPELRLADFARQRHQLERAVQYLEAAQQAYPDHPEPWLRQADLAIAAEDTGRARALLEAAEERGAEPDAVKARRDQLDGEAPATSGIEGIERTVIR